MEKIQSVIIHPITNPIKTDKTESTQNFWIILKIQLQLKRLIPKYSTNQQINKETILILHLFISLL